jgi:serine/threonine protein kinase/formylglycine-generating enzyme required for sulfatase activity
MDDGTDDRLDVEALERLLADRKDAARDELPSFAARDDARRHAADRALRLVEGGSTRPDAPDALEDASEEPRPGGAFGSFKLLSEIGRGGQGVVYLAEDVRLRRRVALKILHRGVAGNDDALLRFRREAELAAKIRHEGVAAVYEVGRTAGRAWMATTYVAGETVSKLLGAPVTEGRPPPDERAVARFAAIVERAARAVHAAHLAGVVHRDLKPSNIVVGPDDVPVVLDFGLAKDLLSNESTLTAPGSVFGTPGYMAPEQLKGRGKIGPGADVFALGAILYRAATGRDLRDQPTIETLRAAADAPPPNARATNPAVSKNLALVVASALEPEPACRYRSAEAFADDLRRCLDGRIPAVRPVSAWRRGFYFARRRKGVVAALASVFLAMATGLVVANEARVEADAHRRRSEERLRTIVQLSDLRRVRVLLSEADLLFPIEPRVVESCAAWTAAADAVVSREAAHRAALRRHRATAERSAATESRAAASSYAVEEDAWIDDSLVELLEGVERLRSAAASVARRAEAASTLAALSTEGEAAEAWRRASDAIRRSSRYSGFELRPQLGLAPLGENEATGLYEFWHVLSGRRPAFDPKTGAAPPKEGDGISLVLLPGVEFAPGVAKWAARDAAIDDAVAPVRLDPFFIAKFETTQDQWTRLDDGRNPAYYKPGATVGDPAERLRFSLVFPVEFLTWDDATRVLSRVGLTLPTEAQWEYACRGGTTTTWWTGDDASSLNGAANCAGAEFAGGTRRILPRPPFSDAWIGPAPVGSLAQNPFGLYDVHGNVAEMCRDAWTPSLADCDARPGDGLREPPSPTDNRVVRGGSFTMDAGYASSSFRLFQKRAAAP